ncbi:MAG: hypothetical protein Q8L48_42780 [Archangium sp.]|nr:hypothetical protein [Archangium sp.]
MSPIVPDESRPALRAVPQALRTRLEGRVETLAIGVAALEAAAEALDREHLGPPQIALLEQVRALLPALDEALRAAEPFDALAELSGQARARLVRLTEAVAHRLRRRPASLGVGLEALLVAVPALVSEPLFVSVARRPGQTLAAALVLCGVLGVAAMTQSLILLLGATVAAIVSLQASSAGGWSLTARHLQLEGGRVVPLVHLAALDLEGPRVVLTLVGGEQLTSEHEPRVLHAALRLLQSPALGVLSPVARAGPWIEAVDELAGLSASLLSFQTGVLLVPTHQRERVASELGSNGQLVPAALVHAVLSHLEQPRLEDVAGRLAGLGVRWIPRAALTVAGSTMHAGALSLSLSDGARALELMRS